MLQSTRLLVKQLQEDLDRVESRLQPFDQNLPIDDSLVKEIEDDSLALAKCQFPQMDWENWHLRLMADTILNELRALLLLPRFGGKSTLTGTIIPAWLIGKDPENESISFVTHTQGYSEAFVRATKDIINYNPYYRAAFGKLETIKSSQNEVVLKRKIEKKTPSLSGLGVGCATLGPHPRRWIIDDVIDRRKSISDAQTRDIKDWFKYELLPAVGRDQYVTVVGTRWRFNDLYGDIIKEGKFKVIHVEAIGSEKTPLGKKYLGQSYWRKIWPLEALLEKKAEVGIHAWMSQYQNDPSLEEGATFNPKWLRYYGPGEEEQLPPREKLRIFQGVDPAIGKKSTAHYFVIVTIGVSEEGSIYLLDYYREHLNPAAQLKAIENQATAWKPEVIGIESVAYQEALVQFVKPLMLPTIGVPQSQDKILRIQGLAPYFESGRVYISRSHEQFIIEYSQFPRGESEVDVLDAFEMALRCATSHKRGGGRLPAEPLSRAVPWQPPGEEIPRVDWREWVEHPERDPGLR